VKCRRHQIIGRHRIAPFWKVADWDFIAVEEP
jgi:hypothetical protein